MTMLILVALMSQVPESKPAQDFAKRSTVITVDEENDGLPGMRVGPTRKEIEELIRRIGRDPVSVELVDRIDGLFRPRWSSQRRYDDAVRRVDDTEFLALIDAAAIELTKKPADTRTFLFRAAIEYESADLNSIREAMRDDLHRETLPKKTIKGRVVDDRNGKPITGAVVGSISGNLARTDARGNYVLKTRPPKTTNPLSITIEAPGYALTQTYFAWDDMANEVTSDQRLMPAIVFGGQVIDPQGKPIAGAVLDLWLHNEAICRDGSLEKVNFNTTITLRTKSGPDGIYAFRNMPPDLPDHQEAVMLTASHPDFEARQKQYQQNEELGVGWQITLEPGCEIKGVVVDESGKPIANAGVRTFAPNVMTSPSTTLTDSEGRFHLGGLSPGKTQIIVQPPGRPTVTDQVMAKRGEPVERKITAGTGFYLTGKVVTPDGKPVNEVTVGWLQKLEANGAPSADRLPTNRFARTKEDGSFRVGPVAKGKYRVTATMDTSGLTGSSDAETEGKDIVIEIKEMQPPPQLPTRRLF
jgi:protocatechuate 3,4-dioxygenase beta subunit